MPRITSALSESRSGRPIALSPVNTRVLVHRAGNRTERVWLHLSNLEPAVREVLVYIGGLDNSDVLRARAQPQTTSAVLPNGESFLLGRRQRVWVLVTAGNVNVFGRIEAA